MSVLSDADGAIHTASPGDETSADLDSAVVDAAIEAFDGTGKPYLHISGAWVYGANPAITEESPFDPPAMVAWKEPIERRVLDAAGMRGVVIVSGVAYGDGGGGIPGLLLGSPRDDDGNLIMLGTGRQHWSTVHVADLADFFRRAAGRRLGPRLLRHRQRRQLDRRRAHRGGRRRGRRPGAVPVPTTRLGPAWATTSPRSCCSIRARTRPGLVPSSVGSRPPATSSTSSGTAATADSLREPAIRPDQRKGSPTGSPSVSSSTPMRGAPTDVTPRVRWPSSPRTPTSSSTWTPTVAEPTQELHGRAALAPVFDQLNTVRHDDPLQRPEHGGTRRGAGHRGELLPCPPPVVDEDGGAR